MTTETENQIRLRRAKEALDACRDAESDAAIRLSHARDATMSARFRYEQLFLAEEQAEVARRKADYGHCTK